MTTATNEPHPKAIPLATLAEAEADVSEARLPRYGQCHSQGCDKWLNASEFENWQAKGVWEAEPHCRGCHHWHWRSRHATKIKAFKLSMARKSNANRK